MKKTDNCKLCRSAGKKLFLKGEKCNLPSCPFLKRSYAPGQSGAKSGMRRGSDFSHQLKEKQKARSIYGVGERQMANYFKLARKTKSETGNKLIQLLEMRIDNVVFRSGWASSRDGARQMVVHKKISLNGKKTKTPSYQVTKGDEISTEAKGDKKTELPRWLKTSKSGTSVSVTDMPTKEDVQEIYEEQLIIEYYSR